MTAKHLPFGKVPCIGDFEASGLAVASYPIEVAWSVPSGDVRSHLIRPDPTWGNYWDPTSEELHGITQKMLEDDGILPKSIATEMNHDLAGETLYFDGGAYDMAWLNKLYSVAGMAPSFAFGVFNTLLALVGVNDGNRRLQSEAMARADIGDLKLHRAAHDVRFLQRWYIRARGGLRH